MDSKNVQASESPDSVPPETAKQKKEPAIKTKDSKIQKPDASAAKSSTIKPSLKREGSSIFKAFAKSKGKPGKLSTENSVATSVSTLISRCCKGCWLMFNKAEPSAAEDGTLSTSNVASILTSTESMKDASEDEQEEDLVLPSSRRSQADKEAALKVKAEREERLRQMMDVDGRFDDMSRTTERCF